ncbi:MAG: MerR family transcriptional regulator [Burkholderiaceae bacterium]
MLENHYSIGEAATRSGLSTHTIRKWEDRYGAVSPHRSAGGTRRYSQTQVDRLVLLKSLIDAGHGIGGIASVETDKLKQMRSANALWDGPVQTSFPRTAIIGPTLPVLFEQNRAQMPGLDIVTGSVQGDDDIATQADVIVIEMPTLDDSAVADLRRIRETSKARCLVVAYRYAAGQTTNQLVSADTACLRMPLDYREVQRAIDSMLVDQNDRPAFAPLPRRYSRSVVAQVAAMKPKLDCECPRHVAELVSALSDFEHYSAQCESSNAEEASLHNYLNIAASHARASLESALSALAEHEGIPLAKWQAQHEAAAGSQL